ncbi:MAG: hypothetical protein ACK4TA_02325, partial [Saprospiraceae bacterium]
MKQFLLLLLITLSSFGALNAQNHWCGAPATSSKWMDAYLKNRGAYPKSNEILYVPVTIQIIGTDEGKGYTSVKNVLNA